MKVLIIPTWYPSGSDKLLGIYHKDFAKALSENKDVSVDLLHIDRQRIKNIFSYPFMKKKVIVNEQGYKSYHYKMLNFGSISFKLQMYLYTRKMDKAFKDYINMNGKPDIIHAHVAIPAGYATAKIGEKYNIPIIVTEHSSYFKRYFKKDNIKYMDFVLKNTTFTTVSKYMKKEILNYTNECEIIPNLVDTSFFTINGKKRKSSTIRLVSVSALRQGKRIDDILKAIKILTKKKVKVHLDIVGDGYYLNYYKQVCFDLKLNKYVSFLGKKTKEEVADIIRNEDVFVISSDLETFSIPGIEALASGIPIVSTRCMGPEEYINDECGILCNIGDPNDMAEAILKCYNKKYNPKKLREIALNFDKEVVIRKTIKLYKKAIKNNG